MSAAQRSGKAHGFPETQPQSGPLQPLSQLHADKRIQVLHPLSLSHGGSSSGVSAVMLSSRQHPAADFERHPGAPCPAGLMTHLPFLLRTISLPSRLLNSSAPGGSTACSQALCTVANGATRV